MLKHKSTLQRLISVTPGSISVILNENSEKPYDFYKFNKFNYIKSKHVNHKSKILSNININNRVELLCYHFEEKIIGDVLEINENFIVLKTGKIGKYSMPFENFYDIRKIKKNK